MTASGLPAAAVSGAQDHSDLSGVARLDRSVGRLAAGQISGQGGDPLGRGLQQPALEPVEHDHVGQRRCRSRSIGNR